jgi:hypothetical protein
MRDRVTRCMPADGRGCRYRRLRGQVHQRECQLPRRADVAGDRSCGIPLVRLAHAVRDDPAVAQAATADVRSQMNEVMSPHTSEDSLGDLSVIEKQLDLKRLLPEEPTQMRRRAPPRLSPRPLSQLKRSTVGLGTAFNSLEIRGAAPHQIPRRCPARPAASYTTALCGCCFYRRAGHARIEAGRCWRSLVGWTPACS